MRKILVEIGDAATFRKTVGETDVYLFAGITGDFAPQHVDEAFMASSPYGARIAHGVLVLGFSSTTSSKIAALDQARGGTLIPVSLGYDRVRFLAGVKIGDTVEVSYRVEEIDEAASRTRAAIEIRNQRRDLVAVATHIMKWLEPDGGS